MKADLVKLARWENLEPYLIRRGKNLIKPIWPAPALYDEVALMVLATGAAATLSCYKAAGSPAGWPWWDMSYHVLVYLSAVARTEIARGMPFEFTSPTETWTKLRTAIMTVKTDCDTLVGFRAVSESRFPSEEDPAFKGQGSHPIPEELTAASEALAIPLPTSDFMERFARRLLADVCSCETSAARVVLYWKEIRKNEELLSSACKDVFKKGRAEQRTNLLWIVALIVASWVCFGPPRELALKTDGSPNGIIASIRESVQGVDFWRYQLDAIRKELKREEDYLAKLPGQQQELSAARIQAHAAASQFNARHLAGKPGMQGKLAANQMRLDADQVEAQFSETMLFNQIYQDAAKRIEQLRALEQLAVQKLQKPPRPQQPR